MIFNPTEFLIENLKRNFESDICLLEDISKDTHNDHLFIQMDYKSIHFDKVPYQWSEGKLDLHSFCVDTLIHDKNNNTLYLIEFKSGWPKGKTQELRLKAYESIGKLMKYWQYNLKKDRKDFFEIKVRYCLITRAQSKQDSSNPRFLDALSTSRNVFSLKNLDNTIVEKTAILIDPEDIFKFLSRITGVNEMRYHHINKTYKDYK